MMAKKVIDPQPIIDKLAARCLESKGLECSVLGSVIDMLRAAPDVTDINVGNKCPYCHTGPDGYVQEIPREGIGRIYIWHHAPIHGGWMLHFSGKNRGEAKIKINFCPMCGRALKEGCLDG